MNADGVRLVSLGIDPQPNTLYVVNAHMRTYLAISRDRSYFHALRPARLEDPSVGDGKRQVGDLLCSCAAGEFGRECYWTTLAAQLERGDVGHQPIRREDIAWMRDDAAAIPQEVAP